MNFLELFKQHDIASFDPLKKIEAIEHYLSINFDNVAQELPLRHHITGTKYAREIFLPKGVLLTSKVHNFDHISVISQGKVSIYDKNGNIETIQAPCTWIAESGMKRLIYAHEDTVWTTFHELKENVTMDKESLTNYIAHDSNLSWVAGLLEQEAA